MVYRQARMRGSYDPIVFKTERGNKKKREIMSDRMSQILRLIAEEANERSNVRDYVSKLYEVLLEVHSGIREVMRVIRDRERELEKEGESG